MNHSFFLLLSGEHETLPIAEAGAILEYLGSGCKVRAIAHQVGLVDCDMAIAKQLVLRSAYVKMACIKLFECLTDKESIIGALSDVDFSQILSRSDRIAVRGVKVRGAKVSVTELEGKIAAKILAGCGYVKVDLNSPTKIFILVATPETAFLGIKICEKPRRYFWDRKAGRRPFSLPSALQPKVSRCMVNLSRPKLGSYVLDPFAGTGSIVLEASLLGYRALGIEVVKWICRGALRNLKLYIPGMESLIVADARSMPLRNGIGAVVTDPPYFRSTTSTERSPTKLLIRFFEEVYLMLKRDSYICIAYPPTVDMEDLCEKAGLKVRECYPIKVHGGLTRNIYVIKADS